MSKNALDVLSVDANSEFFFAPEGTPMPTDADAALNAAFESAGYLEDPPTFAVDKPTSDITAWNADDPIRTLLERVNVEITLKLQQTNALAIELYWGLGTWEAAGDGAIWTPSSGEVVKAGVLHLTDGDNVFRFAAGRFGISSVGNINLARAGAVSYEVTLKRLVSEAYEGAGYAQLFNWVPTGVDLGD